ncbi:DNA-binding protein [Clostridia bacterium]|nr:DNA-binding protein [Clostridia bacterium]
MKIRIDIDENAEESEVIIRCKTPDAEVVKIQQAVLEVLTAETRLQLTREDKDYYLLPEDILFFETMGGKTYAHTGSEVFETKFRLYELEESLPRSFIRVSKSAIVGTKHIYSIAKNITGPSLIQFFGSHKQISVSRQYFRILQDRLDSGSRR